MIITASFKLYLLNKKPIHGYKMNFKPLLFLLVFLRILPATGQHIGKPNIIIYLSDDHGAEDAGCYGNPDLYTPVIDQMAREGMLFTNAFTPVSVCAPSRSALFTGLYPFRNGCDRNHGHIRSDIKTLPDYLRPLGYEVVLAGKRHIQPENAFDFTYLELSDVPGFLKNSGTKPFCLIICTHTPHQPYFNQKGGYQDITPKAWLPNTKETIQYIAAYYDHVTMLDHELGSYMYWVEKYGYSQALQIYTSDHGPAFPFAKWTLYNQGIRVPFIVKWPGVVPEGIRTASLISLVDLLPSLIEIAGDTSCYDLDGKSILPVLQNPEEPIHDYVYATYTNLGVMGANEYPVRAISDGHFKLIVNIRYDSEFHIERMDRPDKRALIDSYGVLQSWLKGGEEDQARALKHWTRPVTELYELSQDPYELDNLADQSKFSHIKSILTDQLILWMERQEDPLSAELKTIRRDL